MKLVIVGQPAPQGNKSAYLNKTTGRVNVVEGKGPGRALFHEWRRAVADAARAWLAENPQPPLSGPLEVDISFRFAPVKSDPWRYWHSVAPDLDKLARAVFDSLQHGGLIANDGSICDLRTRKRYAKPDEPTGCVVEVRSLAAEEAEIREGRKERAARQRRRPSAVDNQERLLA